MENIPSHYGQALYSLALEEDKISSWQKEVKELITVFEENSDFIMVLGSSFLPLKDRQEILEKTLVGVDKSIVALIRVIMENNRTNYLLDILYAFNTYCNEYRGVSEGFVYSTLKLDQKIISQLEEKISKIEKHQVELKNMIDPTLIGGVKIVIHDRIYDGSIKHQLEMMKKDLMK